MICDNCQDEEATVVFVDRKRFDQIKVMRPGAIIECDNPRSFQKYCAHCFDLMNKDTSGDWEKFMHELFREPTS